jgi:hypothetical protein
MMYTRNRWPCPNNALLFSGIPTAAGRLKFIIQMRWFRVEQTGISIRKREFIKKVLSGFFVFLHEDRNIIKGHSPDSAHQEGQTQTH